MQSTRGTTEKNLHIMSLVSNEALVFSYQAISTIDAPLPVFEVGTWYVAQAGPKLQERT